MKTIIFDFDGVIHNTLQDLHKVHCQVLEQISLEDMREKVFSGNSVAYLRKFDENRINEFYRVWEKTCANLEIDGDVKEVLKELAQNYQMFIVSSSTDSILNAYLQKNGIADIFRKVLGVQTHKSKLVKFKMLFTEFNLNCNEVVFVTDTLGDILEANEAGIKTIAVDFWYHDRQKLQIGKPFKIVSDFKEIPTVVKMALN